VKHLYTMWHGMISLVHVLQACTTSWEP
jgi:hypothetical protein